MVCYPDVIPTEAGSWEEELEGSPTLQYFLYEVAALKT